MSRTRLLRTIAATLLVLLATAAPALAHTSVSPGEVAADATVTLTFRAPPERESVNQQLRVLIPEQFVPGECTAPLTWSCAFDTETHAPHTMVTYTAPEQSLVAGITFDLEVTAPSAQGAGVYLFRALQGYADGFTAPWVFEGDTYPAPQVKVGDDDTVRNGAGSENEPCFGPAAPPAEGEEPDGSEQDPCPVTASNDDASTDDTTGTDSTTGTDEPATTDGAADDEADVEVAVAGGELADTGGGAALLAAGLVGIATTMRRRR